MKKLIKSFVSLFLVAVFALALPLVASATVVSGFYNNKAYSTSSSGTVSTITGVLTYASSATLRVETTPTVYHRVNGNLVEYGAFYTYEDVGFGTSFTLSYNYTNYHSAFPNTPVSGKFHDCYFTYKIGTHAVLSNWWEPIL